MDMRNDHFTHTARDGGTIDQTEDTIYLWIYYGQ